MNILSIKLHRPAPPPKRIARPALTLRLNEGLESGRPVTLISAPAGFGKTSCAAEWLADLPLPVAWLSLDADDNDPGRFFTYLAAALAKAGEHLDPGAFARLREVARVLGSGQLPPVEVIADALIADVVDLAESGPARFVLALDDFHLIQERAILKVFEKLIGGLFQANRPQPMHLALLTREDPALPLARLRASGLLTEIRAEALRFSGGEAGRFLNDLMGLELSERDVRVLAERTEGWVAGLQLAGLAMQGTLSSRGRAELSTFIQGLSGSHRYILSYLTEEVLSRQPEAVQQFLLDTAVLDRLCGDLCAAVTGRADSAALLEQLCGANLFLVPLDEAAAGWYRYHHLFADLLRSRHAVLQGGKTADLHRRASRWYAQAAQDASVEERAALISEAVRHAIAAGDYAEAVRLIEAHVMEMLDQWYARMVMDWMQALPAEWSARSPRANLAFARMHLFRADFAQAFPYLERLQALFAEESSLVTPGVRAEWLALQAAMSGVQGKTDEALALASQALAAAPAQDTRTLGQIYLALATAYQHMDDTGRATEAYQQVIRLGRDSGSLVTELLGLSALSLMMIERGKLRYGFELAAQGAERMERAGVLLPICAGIYGELGQVAYHWFRLDEAERYLRRAAQVSALGSFSDAGIFFSVFHARLGLLRGDLELAAREIQRAAEQMRADAPVVVREQVVAQQVIVMLARGDLPGAETVLMRAFPALAGGSVLAGLELGQRIPYSQGVLYLSALRVLLHRARQEGAQGGTNQLSGASELANRLLAVLLQRQYIPLVMEAYLLRAQLHAHQGDQGHALEDAAAALDLAQPEGYISDFVAEGQPIAQALALLLQRCATGSPRADYIQQILSAFAAARPGEQAVETPPVVGQAVSTEKPAALIEPLTTRELEVLRRVAEGSTYEEIAARLVVSINTVRTHVKSIYGKLGANNRTAAIEAARRAGIL